MIKYLRHNEIDKNRWDQCIATSPAGNSYAQSWYLDLVSPNWGALIQDDYQAIMPLTQKKKYGITYLVQPPFCQQLGVFPSASAPVSVSAFVKAIPSGFLKTDIHLNQENTFIADDIFETHQYLNHEIHLKQPYQALFKGYSENMRRNVRKAIKSKVQITAQENPESIIRLFRENKGKNLAHLKANYYQLLDKIIRGGLKRKMIEMKSAVDGQGNVLAGAVFLLNEKRAVFLFSGNSEGGKAVAALPYLIDRFIYDHSEQNRILDFEGSNDPNLARFYKGFGSKECVYLRVRKRKPFWPFFRINI